VLNKQIVALKDTAGLEDVVKLSKTQKKNTIVVATGGKKLFYELPADVMKAVEGTSPSEMKTIVKILSLPARMLRAGATLSFEFMARNPVRDQFTAMIYSKYGYNPFIDLPKGLVHLMKGTKMYDEYKAAGAEQSYFISLDRQGTEIKAKNIMSYKGSGKERVMTYTNPLKALQKLSELSEKGTRLGLYTKARSKGASVGDAMTEARDSTLDFGRIGAIRALNQTIAFWNANVQGTDKMVRTLKDKNTRGKALLRIGLGVTLPSILLWFYNNGDDERRKRYQNLPEWRKNFFLNVVVDGGPIISIPKAFEMGLIFGSLPERLLDYMYHNDSDGLKSIGTAVKDGAWPGLIPTAVLPFVESLTNYSFFRERPIEGMGITGRPAEMRYTPFTTEIAKSVGKMANISPLKFENWVRDWTGTLGGQALQWADELYPGQPPKVGKEWYEVTPGLKGFISKEPIGPASKNLTKFYDISREARETRRGIKILRMNEPEEARKYRADKIADVRIYAQVNTAAKQISNIRKRRDKIVDNKTMDSKRKRELIDKLNRDMSRIADRVVKRYNKLKSS